MLSEFEKQLKQTNLSPNTIESYRHSLRQYVEMYDGVFTKKNLLSFKGFLIEKYAPKTVNLRVNPYGHRFFETYREPLILKGWRRFPKFAYKEYINIT